MSEKRKRANVWFRALLAERDERIKELKKALKFYAGKGTHRILDNHSGKGKIVDHGECARAALRSTAQPLLHMPISLEEVEAAPPEPSGKGDG